MTIERNLGEQPIARILEERGLDARALVEVSTDQLTFKMVTRACKGRRLTPNTQRKVRDALNAAADSAYQLSELFTY